MMRKELSRNEKNFRKYLQKYHPEKYEDLMLLESIEEKYQDRLDTHKIVKTYKEILKNKCN
jgi:hypothetical protein